MKVRITSRLSRRPSLFHSACSVAAKIRARSLSILDREEGLGPMVIFHLNVGRRRRAVSDCRFALINERPSRTGLARSASCTPRLTLVAVVLGLVVIEEGGDTDASLLFLFPEAFPQSLSWEHTSFLPSPATEQMCTTPRRPFDAT